MTTTEIGLENRVTVFVALSNQRTRYIGLWRDALALGPGFRSNLNQWAEAIEGVNDAERALRLAFDGEVY